MMREKFGMGPEQIRHNMKLLNREFEPLRQRSIDSYMEGGEFAKIRSKRLKKAINNEDNIS